MWELLSEISWWVYLILILVIWAVIDITQKKHAVRHNFPIIGNFRYLLESFGPELRQYIVANNREELPFNRRQRSWIYASSKKQNNYQGFGTDQDMSSAGYVLIKPSLLPLRLPTTHPHHITNQRHPLHFTLPVAKVIGQYHKRARPYQPHSIINISAMSYGSLSSAAVTALNQGAAKFGCYHNTGEGGLSKYHRLGADVVFHLGTGYFGARDADGNLDLDRLEKLTRENPVIKMVELKLSQGAKPGKGGILPGNKVTEEIAEARHVPVGKDIISRPYHTAFRDVSGMIELLEDMASRTGLPVGIKSAVGKLDLWEELAETMARTGKGPDFITIDGGEGGTGAAPPSFADHVSLPFIYAFSAVYKIFQQHQLTDRVTFIASGKLGLPDKAIMAFAMGADVINVAREAMMSIGCIQAQLCHTNRCPTGITTNNKWLVAGLDPTLKSDRFYNYVKTFTKEIIEITHAAGYEHPCQFTMNDVDLSMGDNNLTWSLHLSHGYDKDPVPFKGFQSLIDSPYLGSPGRKSQTPENNTVV